MNLMFLLLVHVFFLSYLIQMIVVLHQLSNRDMLMISVVILIDYMLYKSGLGLGYFSFLPSSYQTFRLFYLFNSFQNINKKNQLKPNFLKSIWFGQKMF